MTLIYPGQGYMAMWMTKEELLEEEMSHLTREFILLAAKHDVERLWRLLEMQHVLAYLPSSSLGIMTTLSEHKMSDGSIGLAHFTKQGHFYCNALENEGPVSYLCDIRVTRGAFDLNLYMVGCMVTNLEEYPTKGVSKEEIGWLFTIKPLEEIPLDLRVEYIPRGR
jgi:hypothetical protein